MKVQLIVLFGIAALFHGCAPVFSEMQTARTVGKNRLEAMPSYSSVDYHKDGRTEATQSHLGMQLSFGIDPNVDIRLRYEYIWLKGDSLKNGTSVLGIGPKVSVLKDKIAFSIPAGRSIGTNSDGIWQLHPTLIFTLPAIKDVLDINLSPKYLIVICQDCDNLVAINLGLSFSNSSNWFIRPEYGMLFNPATSGNYSQFSIGVGASFGKR